MTEPKANPNLYPVGGNVQASSGIYIERRADEQMLALCRRRECAYVLSPRQVGKSSLMVHTADRLSQEGIRSVQIDLTQYGNKLTAEQWHLGLLTTIAEQLDLDADIVAWWQDNAHLGFTHRLTLFFEDVLLGKLACPVVIFIDEIDMLLGLPFPTDLFAVIRYLHQARSLRTRARRSGTDYGRLSFVLIGVATPDNLIRDPLSTPFSIGQEVELTDFTFQEASPLTVGLGLPRTEARRVLKWVLKWTGGHPYLTQRLCHEIAVSKPGQWTEARVNNLVAKTFFAERWRNIAHFMTIHEMLTHPRCAELYGVATHDILAAYNEIFLSRTSVPDDEHSSVKSHLKLSGVVHRQGKALGVRNPIYNKVFDRRWIQSSLAKLGKPARDAREAAPPAREERANGSRKTRVFISYKRNASPDEPIAERVYKALRRSHDVFIDQKMPVGTVWGKRIEAELRQADFLISFLSARSVQSEMVQGEIATAHRLAKKRTGRPVILPVRLAYRKPFHYPLSAYLDHISWAFWKAPEDTPRLIKDIKRALSEGELTIKGVNSKAEIIKNGKQAALPPPLPAAQPAHFEIPGGTIRADSTFYVSRPSDSKALQAINQQGVTITIKGPRQMGKSSLLMRTISAAERAGKRTVFLDFQLIDQATLSKADRIFRHFCVWLTEELGLKDMTREYWKQDIGNPLRCTRYLGEYLLKHVDRPLVLALDEVDSVLATGHSSDFFGMLRSWHNKRVSSAAWRNLDLVLVTSTDPYLLIDNLRQSPFNVGQVIELEDFTAAQTADLNRRHGLGAKPPLGRKELERLMQLLHGHPYLVRRALYLVASKGLTAAELFDSAAENAGPFGDHLRYHLFRLQRRAKLVEGLRQVIRENRCRDEETFYRLEGAGLVRGVGRKVVVPRCQLYADYFGEHLDV